MGDFDWYFNDTAAPADYGLRYEGDVFEPGDRMRLVRGDLELRRADPRSLIATQGEMVKGDVRGIIRAGRWDEPVAVLAEGGEYYIIDGHHRAAAASMARVPSIPVRVARR